MPHQFAEYRDEIDSCIGPIEQLMYELQERNLPAHVYASLFGYLDSAVYVLEDSRNEIDEYVEDEDSIEDENLEEVYEDEE